MVKKGEEADLSTPESNKLSLTTHEISIRLWEGSDFFWCYVSTMNSAFLLHSCCSLGVFMKAFFFQNGTSDCMLPVRRRSRCCYTSLLSQTVLEPSAATNGDFGPTQQHMEAQLGSVWFFFLSSCWRPSTATQFLTNLISQLYPRTLRACKQMYISCRTEIGIGRSINRIETRGRAARSSGSSSDCSPLTALTW